MTSSQPASGAIRVAQALLSDPATAATGGLVGHVSRRGSGLVRDEVRLAQAQRTRKAVTRKAKRLGAGAGLARSAGVVAILGLGGLVTAAILGRANVLPGRPAAVAVAVVLVVVAGVLVLAKVAAGQATPPLPTETIAGVRADVAAVKQAVSR